MDDPDGIKLIVTTRTPEAINVSTISELLEAQHHVMKIAMQDVYNPNTVEKARPVRKRPRCSFAADADLLVAGTRGTLLHDSTAYKDDAHEQAYIVQVPKTTKAYTDAADDSDELTDDDSDDLRTNIKRLAGETDELTDDDSDDLPTNIKRLAGETDWPLYPMQPSRYPHLQLLNLRRLPASCESSSGIALPTTQELQQLVEASLFYDAPVVVANLSATSLCAFALYPEFIRRLRDYSTSEQRRRIDVMQHNTKVCLSKVVTPEKLVQIYRHLLGVKQAGPVIWLNILPLAG
tara:strand:- start:75 stop:950 length:876 start_codon:yes stop_codon:yes gene_type:complete